MMKRIINLFVLMLVCSAGISQSIVTDRPTQGVSSEVVPLGAFQVETGVGIELTPQAVTGLNHRSFVLPTSLFRIPIANKLELRVANTLRFNKAESFFDDEDGRWQIDDLQAGFKWKITGGETWRPQIALMSHVVVPTGSQLNTPYGLINKILVSNNFSNGVCLGYNIGYDFFGEDNQSLTYTLGLAFPVSARVGAYIESYGTYYNFETFITNANAGFTYLLNDNLQFDYSFGIGVNNRMNYQALGVSFLFEKK